MPSKKTPVVKPFTFTFMASLPPIQSAITFDGMGDGARIKLDLPRSESGAAVLLQQKGAGKLLKVTVEIIKDIKPATQGNEDDDDILSRVLGDSL